MSVTNGLAALMQKRHITEEKLAALTGMRQGHINQIKNSKRIPNVVTALRIAQALKVPVERIWSFSNRDAA